MDHLPTSTHQRIVPSGNRLLSIALALTVVGCAPTQLQAAGGQLELHAVDKETGEPVAVRMFLTDARGRHPKVPRSAWQNGTFVVDGGVVLTLAQGHYQFVIERGLEYKRQTGHFHIRSGASDTKTIQMERFINMAEEGWYSGDLYTQRDPADMPKLMRADDLFLAGVSLASDDTAKDLQQVGQRHLFSLRTHNADNGRTDDSVWGVWPLEPNESNRILQLDVASAIAIDLPARIATGHIKSICVFDESMVSPTQNMGPIVNSSAKMKATQRHYGGENRIGPTAAEDRENNQYRPPRGPGVWLVDNYFRLLEAGIHLPPCAASFSGKNGNPVGYNRLYVHVKNNPSPAAWRQSLLDGKVIVTNGPVMQPKVNDQLPGYIFRGVAGDRLELEASLFLATTEKILYLEIIRNGEVAEEVHLDKWAAAHGKLPRVEFTESGWMLIRAVTDNPDAYHAAMSGPFFVEFSEQKRISRSAADYFLGLAKKRGENVAAKDAGNDRQELHRQSIDFWTTQVEQANAP